MSIPQALLRQETGEPPAGWGVQAKRGQILIRTKYATASGHLRGGKNEVRRDRVQFGNRSISGKY
jgi:hypothetical protein